MTDIEKEIKTEHTPIFDRHGRHINPGYATHMVFDYHRQDVRKKMRLKEWDYYQVNNARYVLEMTIGHVAYAQNASIMLIDLEKKTTESVDILRLFHGASLNLPGNDEPNHVSQITTSGLEIKFIKEGAIRRLTANAIDKKGRKWLVDVSLEEFPHHQAMVINTPYTISPYHFYLNYKINSLRAHGTIQIDQEIINFNPQDSFGLLDWGRGVWPYEGIWYWGNLSASLPDSRVIGLNLGYGFGDLTYASENMLFLDGKAYKLRRIYLSKDIVGHYNEPFELNDLEGKVHLKLTPIYDRLTNTNLKVIFMTCHQLHAYYSGTIKLDDGQTIHFDHLLGFFERSHNRW